GAEGVEGGGGGGRGGRDGPWRRWGGAPRREDLHEDGEGSADVLEGVLQGVPARVRDAEGIVIQIVRRGAAPEGVGARRDDKPAGGAGVRLVRIPGADVEHVVLEEGPSIVVDRGREVEPRALAARI